MRKKTVPVNLLKFGMYVHELDRPWTDTPFMFQGFVLRNMEQLEALKKYCKFVYVDFDRSELTKDAEKAALAQPAQSANRLPPEPKVSVEHELVSAGKAYSSSKLVLEDTFAAVRAGKLLEPEKMKEAVAEITASVMRNPDALQLFSRLEEKGEYTLGHALDVSVYMSTFGRFLEMDHDEIVTLGYLGLLQDIGKLKVPNNLIEKRDRLNTEEFEEAKKHVQYSVELLESTPNLPPELPRLAALHHERYDGSGYPKGLKGEEIGLYGSIAAIVDTFGALTLQRPYAEDISPSSALGLLYKQRGTHFHPGLVEQFIQCVGVFPVGCVVELNTGEVGIVIAQNPLRRLKPRVMVALDAKGYPMRPHLILDLNKEPMSALKEPYQIRRALEHSKLELDPRELTL